MVDGPLIRAIAEAKAKEQMEAPQQPVAPSAVPAAPTSIKELVAQHQANPQRISAESFREAYGVQNDGTFQRSLDGDTIEIGRGKLRTSTRLNGIDTPESAQELGPEAHAFLDKLVKEHGNGKIRVGSRAKDIHGRDVSILYAGDKNLNVEMVRAGYAKVYRDYTWQLSKDVQKQLLDAEDEARTHKRGMWGLDHELEDAAAYRRRVGPQNMALGHDNRDPVDPSTRTLKDFIREQRGIRESQGLSYVPAVVARGSHGGGGGGGDGSYPEEGTFLEKATGALDYLGNISRSAIKGLFEGKAAQYAGEAAMKHRRTTATDLRDTVSEKLGLGKVRLGKDDGEFQAGDLGDFAMDLGVDIATDPLTWVTAGFGSLAKGGKLAKVLPKLAQGAQEAKQGSKAGSAVRQFLLAKQAAGAGIGAAYGVGSMDAEDSLGSKLLAAGAGAIVGANAPKAMEKAGAGFRALSNKGANKYAEWTRGSRFADYTTAREVAQGAYDKMKTIVDEILQGRFQVLDGLDEAQKLRVTNIMQAAKTETLRLREIAERKIKAKPGTPEFDRQFNAMMKKLNYDVEQVFVKRLLKNEENAVATAVGKWAQHNDDVMKKFNTEVFGLEKADSRMRNVGQVFEKGTYVRDPDTGVLMKSKDFYDKYSLDDIAEMREILRAEGKDLEKIDLGRFANRDIAVKPGQKDFNIEKNIIREGQKITDFDMAQKASGKAEKNLLQDGTWLEKGDTVTRKKDFQPYNPREFKGGKGVVGLRYHIDDVHSLQDIEKRIEDVEKAMVGPVVHKAESLQRSASALEIAEDTFAKKMGRPFNEVTSTAAEKAEWQKHLSHAHDRTYQVYAERFAKTFMSEAEKEAVTLMREYGETAAKQKPIRALETVLDSYDKVTNFAKAQMLYMSMSWIKNNYFDNLAKAYVETGWHGLVDTATMGKFQKGVFADVKDIFSGNVHGVYKSSETMGALKRGVLDNPMFKSIHDEELRGFLFRPKELEEKLAKRSLAVKIADAISKNPINQKVASFGSHMEGTARMVTYLRAKEALLKSPRFKNATPEMVEHAKDLAAELTKKAFFDYGNVTKLEKAVFGRIVPFYSFYSKNLPYWIGGSIDPEKVGRLLAFEKARRNVGTDPTHQDREGMTDYLLNNGARKLGKDQKGNTRYGIFPSGSLYDAIRMLNPKDWGSQVVEKGNTLPKAAYELASGNDLFDGGKLYPSDNEKGKKFLFSRGFKYKALGIPGVEVDEGGNPYATSDTVVALDKILSTLVPHGIVDQAAGTVGKIVTGKDRASEGAVNRLSPMQVAKVSAAYARMVRKRKEEERAKDGK